MLLLTGSFSVSVSIQFLNWRCAWEADNVGRHGEHEARCKSAPGGRSPLMRAKPRLRNSNSQDYQ